MKAEAQHLEIVENANEADEAYTYEWALNPAEVSGLLYMKVETHHGSKLHPLSP